MDIEGLISKWWGSPGGAERANFPIFIADLCKALGLPEVHMSEGGTLGAYQFEAPVAFTTAGEKDAGGRIDLYRRGCFVLEAKQSRLANATQPTLLPDLESAPAAPSGARYDKLMREAFKQAESYARALPADHGWPPYLIVCDVGRAFEIYFDWSGMGKAYGYFPNKASYRIELQQLRDASVADRLRKIWLADASIDPRKQSAEVTRDVARRLAYVSEWLEKSQAVKVVGKSAGERSLALEQTSLFLMRVLFCMFAEDVGLLPENRFKEFLEQTIDDEQYFEVGLRELFELMGRPGSADRYSTVLRAGVRYFNGNLFTESRVYSLGREDRGQLFKAAKHDWSRVEPAIFGTLLEQALVPEERAKLGAHYTPRPYVERLVEATVMEPLRAEWAEAQGWVEAAMEAGDTAAAVAGAKAFHDRLKAVRILDPACGTGNFLYVSMELLLRLESQVVELLQTLGQATEPGIGPQNLLGLELNPRAAVIAELVLWIGWLRFRLKNDPTAIPDPVLDRTVQINFGRHGGYDACLALNEYGSPDLESPRPAEWPEADFIVGNPPFIGAKFLRAKLAPGYAEALWRAGPAVPASADFVMQWWSRAAVILAKPGSRLRRFGFVTTNSITQTFSRRVMADAMAAAQPISLVMAIPDHPWLKQPKLETGRRRKGDKGPAAVRIAMTVAEVGQHEGELLTVTSESNLDGDQPKVELARAHGAIHADLTVGANATAVTPLRANEGLASPGVKLHGDGFIVTPAEAAFLGLGKRPGLEGHIREYRNGRDLLQRSRGVMVIDLFGLLEAQVMDRFPEVYQHVLATVKPEREKNNRPSYRLNWWVFGEARVELRRFLAGLDRYIVTPVTAKHRIFSFVESAVQPDDALMAIGVADNFVLGVLSSFVHHAWVIENATLIGVASVDKGHRYIKSSAWDPFPFPAATPEQAEAIGDMAERLDATRKAALAESPDLTMTGLYNLMDGQRKGGLTPAQQKDAMRGRVGIIAKLHDDLDAAVAAAYGWPVDLPPAEIVARLVALNAERAAEEAEGKVRWLRPDYQIPRFAKG